jgi:hypothetical protein
MEDEGQYEKDMQPDDVVADEDMQYESDENHELKPKEKPVGPPLDLVVPFRQPPARPDKVSELLPCDDTFKPYSVYLATSLLSFSDETIQCSSLCDVY